MTIICDTVKVTVSHPDKGEVTFTLPAFTRDPADFQRRIWAHAADYAYASAHRGQPVSVADFVLFLIVQAAAEPREQ